MLATFARCVPFVLAFAIRGDGIRPLVSPSLGVSPRPAPRAFSGRILDPREVPVAEAGVAIEGADHMITYLQADADGVFQLAVPVTPLLIVAWSRDAELVGVAEERFGPRWPVVLAPAAIATGVLADEDGVPLPDVRLDWSLRTAPTRGLSMSGAPYGPSAITGREGRFRIPGLIAGRLYDVRAWRGNALQRVTRILPAAPGPIDLGVIRIRTRGLVAAPAG